MMRERAIRLSERTRRIIGIPPGGSCDLECADRRAYNSLRTICSTQRRMTGRKYVTRQTNVDGEKIIVRVYRVE